MMSLIIFAIPIFFLMISVELIIAKLSQTKLYRLNDTITNINCGVTQQLLGIFVKGSLLLLYIYIYENHRLVAQMPSAWWVYGVLFLGVDFFYYWFHRLAHEVSVFWGTHIVHHQSEEYNLSVALRQSAFQSFVSTSFYLPLAFIGFHPVAFVLISEIQTLYQFWIHTKLIDKLPAAFEYVFNTPSHHRVHHGRNPKYIDKNHGGTLIIFDRLFGTFQQEEEKVVFGVTKPFKSWNPIWANFDYYADLRQELKTTSGFANKFQLLFNKPGWQAQELGKVQQQEVPPLDDHDEHTVRFETHIPIGLNYYVLANFIILQIGLGYFISQQATISLWQNLTWAMLILAIVACIAWLLEYRKIGFIAESLRLLLTPICLAFLLPNNTAMWVVVGIFGVLNLLMLACLWRYAPQQNPEMQ